VEIVFSAVSDPRLYNEDRRPTELELMGSLEMAVEDDSEEMARKKLVCAKKTSYVLYIE
jgi:hypothetical protein